MGLQRDSEYFIIHEIDSSLKEIFDKEDGAIGNYLQIDSYIKNSEYIDILDNYKEEQ